MRLGAEKSRDVTSPNTIAASIAPLALIQDTTCVCKCALLSCECAHQDLYDTVREGVNRYGRIKVSHVIVKPPDSHARWPCLWLR